MSGNMPEQVEILVRPKAVAGGFSTDKGPTKGAAKLRDALPALASALKGPLNDLYIGMITGTESPPDEVELNIGLSFEGGVDWKIVAASAEANFTMTLRWKAKA